MKTSQDQVALPLRPHTILGVCEGIGEDFGFNPVFLRIPFAAGVLWSPSMVLLIYFTLGAVVLASRMLFPRARQATEAKPAAQVVNVANEQAELASAA